MTKFIETNDNPSKTLLALEKELNKRKVSKLSLTQNTVSKKIVVDKDVDINELVDLIEECFPTGIYQIDGEVVNITELKQEYHIKVRGE